MIIKDGQNRLTKEKLSFEVWNSLKSYSETVYFVKSLVSFATNSADRNSRI